VSESDGASETTSVRKHLYLITEHENDDRVGLVTVLDTRLSRSAKNEETPIHVLDEEAKDFRTVGKQVSLGYVDFESEQDYEKAFADELDRKLAEIDDCHLHKAGHDPAEVEA
jgi:hypothetical protein